MREQIIDIWYTKGLDKDGSIGLLGERMPSVGTQGWAGVNRVVKGRAFQAEGIGQVEVRLYGTSRGTEHSGWGRKISRWKCRTSLVVQWLRILASTARGIGLIPGREDPVCRKVWPKKKKKDGNVGKSCILLILHVNWIYLGIRNRKPMKGFGQGGGWLSFHFSWIPLVAFHVITEEVPDLARRRACHREGRLPLEKVFPS